MSNDTREAVMNAPSLAVSTGSGHDPYHGWLGIMVRQRPLNAYQLLGLEPLESNLTKIKVAAQKQRRVLAENRSAANAQLWERISGELDEAVDSLLNPDKKAVVDAALRRRAQLAAPVTSGDAAAPIRCPHCERENSSDRRFCAQCGRGIWEQCAGCGATCPADAAFCGGCGSNLKQAYEQQVLEFEQHLQRANELRAAHRYREAITALRKLAATENARLEQHAQRALQLIQQCEDQCRAMSDRADELFQQAEQLVDQYQYQEALEQLEQVPAELRRPELMQLLGTARQKRDQTRALEQGIRAALQEKRTLQVAVQVEQLLKLNPEHAFARKLTEQLVQRLVLTARKQLALHRYEPALKYLDHIPPPARTDEIRQLMEKLAELRWLEQDLQTAPVIDGPLLAIGKRLTQLAPGNEAAAQLYERLKRRAAEKPSHPRCAAVSWAPASNSTQFGCPIDWLTYPQGLVVRQPAARTMLARHAGRFFVACGLALQGLDKGPLRLSLLPQQQSAVLSVLGLGKRKKPARSAWGLDLNQSSLKAVKLVAEPDDRVVIEQILLIPHRKLLNQPDADLERTTLIQETLASFLKDYDLTGDCVCINLPGEKLLGRYVHLPPLPPKTIPEIVRREAAHQIPLPLEELVWKYQLLGETDKQLDKADWQRRVMLVAAKQIDVRDRLRVFQDAGIKVDILQGDPLALHNFAATEFCSEWDSSQTTEDCIATIDVGTTATNIVVSGPGVSWFRTIPMAGNDFTSKLVRLFKLTHQQAEQLKELPTRARSVSQVYRELQPLMTQFSAEVKRSLESFHESFSTQQLCHVWCVGGGMQLHGLVRELQGLQLS